MKGTSYRVPVNLADDGLAELVLAILDCERHLNGLDLGQAAYELIMRAADADSYPAQVRDQLKNADERLRERAAEKALAAINRERVA